VLLISVGEKIGGKKNMFFWHANIMT
jgi:hypothetical protein